MKSLKLFSGIAFFLLVLGYRWTYSTDGRFLTTFLLVVIDLDCILTATLIINRILVPRFLLKSKYFIFVLSFIACIVFFSQLFQFADWQIHVLSRTLSERFIELSSKFSYQIFNSYIIMIVGTVFGFTIEMLAKRVESDKLSEQLLKEKTEAELNFLKAQINPHFLFNSINTIFFQIDKNNSNARQSLLKFSEMLRYQLYDCMAERIFIENVFVHFNCSESVKEFSIAPLVLISFVENAFKHVSNFSGKENKISIDLDKKEDEFHFRVFNTNEIRKETVVLNEGGIGLSNVKRRIELIYNGNHELKINKQDNSFEVTLKLKL